MCICIYIYRERALVRVPKLMAYKVIIECLVVLMISITTISITIVINIIEKILLLQ